MMLGQLIEALKALPYGKPVRHGFGAPMSYRGYYEDVAFKPVEDTTIGQMLEHARSALGATFEGYKGGEYTMGEYTTCWIDSYGSYDGNGIGFTLLAYWGDAP